MADAKALKKGKKKWISIYAQKQFFNGAEVGETYIENLSDAVGKVLKVNLMSLTGDPKKQSFYGLFKVTSTQENSALADMVGYQMSTSQIRRLIRRASNKLEESFTTKTKDNVNLIIKPLILTRYQTNRSVLADLRKKTREFINDALKATDYSSAVIEVISGKLQKDLRLALKKIYPIAIVEIKTLKKL